MRILFYCTLVCLLTVSGCSTSKGTGEDSADTDPIDTSDKTGADDSSNKGTDTTDDVSGDTLNPDSNTTAGDTSADTVVDTSADTVADTFAIYDSDSNTETGISTDETDTSVVPDTLLDFDTGTITEFETDSILYIGGDTLNDTGIASGGDSDSNGIEDTVDDTGSVNDTGTVTEADTVVDTDAINDTGTVTDTGTVDDTGPQTDTGSDSNPEAECMPDVTNGNEVLIIGDSVIAATHMIPAKLEELAKEAGGLSANDHYLNSAEYTAYMSAANGEPTISEQYHTAQATNNVRQVIMTGGSFDCAAAGEGSKAYTAAATLFQDMADDGVESVMYMFYADPTGIMTIVKDCFDAMRPQMKALCDGQTELDCTFIDLRESFDGHPEYLADGLIPTLTGARAAAIQVWEAMTGCEVDLGGVCMTDATSGDEVQIIGDFMFSGSGIQYEIMKLVWAAGTPSGFGTYRNSSEYTSYLYNINEEETIPYQYRSERVAYGTQYVIMSGGAWDCQDGKGAESAYGAVLSLFNSMAYYDVKGVVYMFNPDPLGMYEDSSLTACLDALRPRVQVLCEKHVDLPCAFVDLRESFDGHPEYVQSVIGLTPTAEGAVAAAAQVWDAMREGCDSP